MLVYSLAVFYFLISVGLTTNIHFCKGKVRKISLVGFSKEKSCCAGKPMKKGCCKDVKVCFKKSSLDQQTTTAVLFLSPVIPSETFALFIPEKDGSIYVPKNIEPSVHAPPPELRIPTYLKHCVFII